MTGDDPYAALGLDRAAGAEEIRHQYFRLVRKYSPETNPEEFKRIRAAYETLRSPVRRAESAVLSFDKTAGDVDLDRLARVAGQKPFNPVEALLALEMSVSDLARSEFPEDLSPVSDKDLLG